MSANYLNVTIRIQQGQVVRTVRDGTHSLVAFDRLPRSSHALEAYSLS